MRRFHFSKWKIYTFTNKIMIHRQKQWEWKLWTKYQSHKWRCITFIIGRIDSLISTMLINAINARNQMTKSDGVYCTGFGDSHKWNIYEKVLHFLPMGEKYGFNGCQSLSIVNTQLSFSTWNSCTNLVCFFDIFSTTCHAANIHIKFRHYSL